MRHVKQKSIDQKTFEMVNTFHKQHGLKYRQIADITGFSYASIFLWCKYGTWEKYCEHKKEMVKKYTLRDRPLGRVTPIVTGRRTYPTTNDLVEALNRLTEAVNSLNENQKGKHSIVW